MKKTSLISGIVLLILIAIYYKRLTIDSSNEDVSAKEYSTPQEQLEADKNNFHEADSNSSITRTVENPKREQEYIKQRKRVVSKEITRLREQLQASEQDILSATANVEVNLGETLVTGGYQTLNGNYELNFLTPSNVTYEDESKLKLESKIISLSAEVIEKLGLKRLITDEKNTLQHSEVWTQEILNQAFAIIAGSKGVDMMTAPSVLANPKESFAIQILGEGESGYLIMEGSLDKTPDGSFKIESVVERYEKPTL